MSLSINSIIVTPFFAGLSQAGLYQINVKMPEGAGTGDVALVATVGGLSTQMNVVLSLNSRLPAMSPHPVSRSVDLRTAAQNS